MIRTNLPRLLVLTSALSLALLAGGCRSGDFSRVCPGMMFSDVEHVMGEPERVIHGDKVDAGRSTWIYPEGKVLFEGCTVIQVEPIGHQPGVNERLKQVQGR